MPKGVDPITLNDVKAILRETSEGITAIELSEQTGMGRSTARRYLEYLVSVKMLRASVKYGTVGRPERLYSLRGVYEQNGSNKK
ncbi:helix-turn-helix domain-containing protein [Virgibacillus sp. 179-BFC.A HS]|uniref:Helix-turn-helix domain-containing protein n=1 Tax=Tigheibacillus jepli TaxID=3035914 RepID=A0ABU5CH68_9BACI|nr:helix-turn-helix domain-containing protein [Virgibacillus sp. 179-BFC.A HS]MDY0404888.1 helix-turn-helix domain-containing protein [Virgibacillus sp. 179-BFC.A HS]